MDLQKAILDRVRDIPDYPKPGIMFKDITPLLADHVTFAGAVDAVVAHYGRGTVDKIIGIEARGFIIAAPIAYHFGAGFVPVRKIGKLPASSYRQDYDLEYGTETIEMHRDALQPGERVVIVDDVLATGGTAAAAVALAQQAGAKVAGVSVLLELSFLAGRDRVTGVDVHTLVTV